MSTDENRNLLICILEFKDCKPSGWKWPESVKEHGDSRAMDDIHVKYLFYSALVPH